MSTKAKLSRLQCRSKNSSLNRAETYSPEITKTSKSPLNTTPIALKNNTKDDMDEENSSPFLIRFTQDSCEDDMDVIWEWDSPKSKGNRNIFRKRILHSSPNLPKKHVTHDNKLPKFNSLKAELELLASSLNNQEDLIETENTFVKPETPKVSFECPNNIDDLFEDDFFDEELVKCSQQIEEAFTISKLCNSPLKTNNNNFNESIKLENKNLVNNVGIQDDSFDCFLEEIKDDEIDLLSQKSNSFESQNTQPLIVEVSNIKPASVSSPRAIARTNSVPTEFLFKNKTISNNISPSKFVRTKSEDLGNKMKCSPEEIEKKRQEARARLEFKRKEKEIEKKRLEALERLKRNRMQRIKNSQKNNSTGKPL